jgi:hypothetical protein
VVVARSRGADVTKRRRLGPEGARGVGHHALLSIVGVHRVEGNADDAGKRRQERSSRRARSAAGDGRRSDGAPTA